MNPTKDRGTTAIFTIGHSNHPLGKFIEMLRANGIGLIADVRTIPKSRHNPHYNSDVLAVALPESRIDYHHLPLLGGLRHPKKDSINSAWENDSFRGFADYMQTEGFAAGLSELLAIGREQRTAVMCAEALPWRCHRSLIADALLVRGVAVTHIMSRTSVKEHSLTPWARVQGMTITYPP
jgi:uncharacterized protein (DUF488 family)